MKNEKQVKECLKDMQQAVKEYKDSDDEDRLIYEGWVEALEWMLFKPKTEKQRHKGGKANANG